MSTRQLRLSSTDKIKEKSPSLIGKKINIVLRDQTSILATLKSAEHSSIRVINMRLKEVTIPIESISEVYYDTKE